jgi:hypothetical protein
MLKKTVTYEDFDGKSVTEDLYFHLSKSEIVEMKFGDMSTVLEAMTQKDAKPADILAAFKRVIGMTYGVKSQDGRRFHKSPEQTEEFLASPAYDALFMSLITGGEQNAVDFITAVLPSDMAAQIASMGAGIKVDFPVTDQSGGKVTITPPPAVAGGTTADTSAADTTPAAFRRKGPHRPNRAPAADASVPVAPAVPAPGGPDASVVPGSVVTDSDSAPASPGPDAVVVNDAPAVDTSTVETGGAAVANTSLDGMSTADILAYLQSRQGS